MPNEPFRHGAAIDGKRIAFGILPIIIERQVHSTLSELNLQAKWLYPPHDRTCEKAARR